MRELIWWISHQRPKGQKSGAEVTQIRDRVEKALAGTSNSPASGPDGITYPLIKLFKEAPLLAE